MFESSLTLYRKVFKRFRLMHVVLHWLITHLVIPSLEWSKGFRTIPDDPFWFRLELLTQHHETETTRQVEMLAQPGMVVLDIGAHVGYYSRLCAHLIGSDGRVVAFEPHPRTYSVLCQNVGSFSNVTPLQIALSEEEGTAELYDYLMMSASGSLHYDQNLRDLQQSQLTATDIAPRINGDFQMQQYSVRTARVDDILDELGIDQVDLVKMDIEGAEMSALRGMQQTIQRSPGLLLVMEYNPRALTASGFDPVAALQEVLAMGFASVSIIEPDASLTDITSDEAAIHNLTDRLMADMSVVNVLLRRSNVAETTQSR